MNSLHSPSPSSKAQLWIACLAHLATMGLMVPEIASAKQTVQAGNTPLRNECVIIDNDFDIDDMQAIPLVIGGKHVAAIVQSEGYTLPGIAAPAVNKLVNQIPDQPANRRIPVIVGGQQAQSPDLNRWPWLAFFRKMMNRANGLLPSEPVPWPLDSTYPQKVATAVNHCKTVEVLVIGTYTSFNKYSPLIANKIKRVVIMGQRIGDETSSPGRDSFNCTYDFEACKSAMPILKNYNTFFVDVPRLSGCANTVKPAASCYNPSLEMVIGEKGADGRLRGGLLERGLPGRLKQALINPIQCSSFYTTSSEKEKACTSQSTWVPAAVSTGPGGEMLLWDQSAALFLLDPSKFSLYINPDKPKEKGLHYQPTLVDGSHEKTVNRLRQMWTTYTNNSITFK